MAFLVVLLQLVACNFNGDIDPDIQCTSSCTEEKDVCYEDCERECVDASGDGDEACDEDCKQTCDDGAEECTLECGDNPDQD